MADQESAEAIDAAAAEWAIKLDEHEDAELQARADEWLRADRRRAGALLRAQAALAYLDRGRALAGPGDDLARPSPSFSAHRRQILLGASVAGVAALLGGLAFLRSQPASYDTAIGEIRHIPLQDGSAVALNTASEIGIELKPDIRQIDLDRGEAWFRVMKDPKRPFVVVAGAVYVRAVGTAFSVRRRANGTDVVVTEGIVESWVAGDEVQKITLTAGQKAFVSQDEQPQIATIGSVAAERSLAWRDGQISFYGETLAAAAAEFNRYNEKKLAVANLQLAEEKVVGQFHTDEPEEFARAVALMFDARISEERGLIRLSRPPRK